MKASYDLTVTYKDGDGVIKKDEYSRVVFDYIDNGNYFFVQETDKGDSRKDMDFSNELHWYPKANIIRIDGLITRKFETKKERLDYYKAKNGIPVKGNKIKN